MTYDKEFRVISQFTNHYRKSLTRVMGTMNITVELVDKLLEKMLGSMRFGSSGRASGERHLSAGVIM